ncbi:MAG TPA: Gfo/Idh/MocA family oxidoreductase [Tepidisphaeraceae bacterium]|jgi:predicted dehydrogenase|nr:Gfo/Idh/MocA family oxidoreductase [Tepidisphaeraceae bacterium]
MKLKLIQAGVGGMGKAWWSGATNSSPDFELAAIVDISDAALNEAGDALKIPGERRFKTLEEAINRVEADAVLTVTPPVVHVEHAKLAFGRGLHLLTEKPLAHDLAAAKLMVQLAARAGKQLLVAQNYRYNPMMTKLREIMRDKPVGELGHGHLDFYIPADFTGSFRETMEFPLLVDMAIHHIDLIRAVTGRSIRQVTAQTFNPKWSWYQHHAGLKMLMELDGGMPFSYSGDWSAIGRTTGWSGNWRLQCAEGSIHLEQDKIEIWRCEKWGKDAKREEIAVPPLNENGQQALLRRFAEAIRSGTPGETNGQDNLWSYGTVMAGVISAKEGRKVDVAELLDAY